MSNKISKFLAKSILLKSGDDDTEKAAESPAEAFDPLSLDLSLMELVSFVNLYQKTITPDNESSSYVTPLEYLSRGENAAGELAYDMGDDDNNTEDDDDGDELEILTTIVEPYPEFLATKDEKGKLPCHCQAWKRTKSSHKVLKLYADIGGKHNIGGEERDQRRSTSK